MTCCEKNRANKINRIRVELSSLFMFYEAHCTCEKALGISEGEPDLSFQNANFFVIPF